MVLSSILPNCTSVRPHTSKMQHFSMISMLVTILKGFFCSTRNVNILQPVNMVPCRIWTPSDKYKTQSKRLPNCKYQWLFNETNHGSTVLVYLFTIHQNSCHTNVTPLGGSTFDIFAYNSFSTVSCSYADTRNNMYQVQCHMPCVTYKCIEELRIERHDCVQVTAVLAHKHYDSFGEITLTTEEPVIRTVLQDNQTYCMGTTASDRKGLTMSVSEVERKKHNSHSQQTTSTWTSPLTLSWDTTTLLPPGVRVYSGIWITEPLLKLLILHHHHRNNDTADHITLLSDNIHRDDGSDNDGNRNSNSRVVTELKSDNTYTTLYAYSRMENLTAISLHTREHQLVNYTDLIISTNLSVIPPKIAMFPPSELEDRLSLLPQIHLRQYTHNNHNNSRYHPVSYLINGFDYNHNYNHNHSMSSNNKTTAAATATAAALVAIQDKKYTFMGSSHMRYILDAVVEHYLGADILSGIGRKHADIYIANFTYDINVYAKSIASSLQGFCDEQGNVQGSSHSSSGHILFLQTGNWDLKHNGLRYTIDNHPNSPGYRLLNVLNDIFTGNIPYYGISHIVWMTTVPHPLCFSHEDNSECDKVREHHLNANIRALNDFFLRGILSSYGNTSLSSTDTTGGTATTTAIRNRVGLSVIDAFSVVHPRLIYDENNEVVCLNHFSGKYYVGNVMNTPGGAAIVQCVLSTMTMTIT
eukprot:gene3443-6845_t